MTGDISPVHRGSQLWLKRDDLWEFEGVRGAKARATLAFILEARKQGKVRGLTTCGSRISPQINRAAHVARALGLPLRAHAPAGDLLPELALAQAAGAELVFHRPGYMTVCRRRALDDARERGWLYIPFGLEARVTVAQAAAQVANLPFGEMSRLVVPCGSGMTLAGILEGLARAPRPVPVLAVRIGGVIKERVQLWGPILAPPYAVAIPRADYQTPQLRTITTEEAGPVRLDPYYEAKAVEFLRAGDCLWLMGYAQSADLMYEQGARRAAATEKTGRAHKPGGDRADSKR